MNTAALLAASNSGSPFGLLILLLPIGAIIFLTIVPQRKQRQKQAQLANSLSVGDEVVTIGGILGVINHIEDDIVHLEVDNDVVVRLSKGAISRNVAEPDPSAPAARSRGMFARGADTRGATGDDEAAADDDSAAGNGKGRNDTTSD